MEAVAGDGECAHFGLLDLDALRVRGGVEFAGDLEAGGSGGGGDQLDDSHAAGEWPGAPILRDMTEQAVLDLVPLRGTGRIMADRKREPGLVGKLLQFDLPQPYARAVGATAVGGDHEAAGGWISRTSHLRKPAA